MNNFTYLDFLDNKEETEELIDDLILYEYGKYHLISARNMMIINKIKKYHNTNILIKQLEELLDI